MSSYLILIYIISAFQNSYIQNKGNIINNIEVIKDPFNLNLLTIEVKINKRKIIMPIDISSDLIWLMTNSQDDSSITEQSLFNEQCIISSDILNDAQESSIEFGNIIYIKSIKYIDISSSSIQCNYRSTLGLARLFADKSFSIFDTLKNSNYRYFSISMNTSAKGIFSISKYNFFPSTKQTIQFRAIESGKKWGGIVEGVIIGDLSKEMRSREGAIIYDSNYNTGNYLAVNSKFHFETLHRFIMVTKEIFGFIENKLFNRKQCENKIINQLSVYFCNQNIISKFDDINFVIQENVFTFNSKNLFEMNKNSEEAMFLIATHIQYSHISFGHAFLSRYSIGFDMDNLFISIKSNNEIIAQLKYSNQEGNNDNNRNNGLIIKKVTLPFIIAFISAFIGIILLLISLLKQKVMPIVILPT